MVDPDAETGPADTARRPGRRRLLLTAGILVLSVVAAEVIVRLAVPAGRLVRITQLDESLYGDERHQFLEVIRDDPETFWSFAPDLLLPPASGPFFGRVSNDQGLRENRHIPVPKPDGELRILFLGDSCTYGYALDERHTFVAFAEEKLRQRFPDRRIECINAGVPGYTAFQSWRRLVTEGLAYQPDLVVLQGGWNDRTPWDGRSDHEHYAMLRACRPPGILAASRLCQLLWTSAHFTEPGAEKRPRVSPAEFRDLLARIEAAARGGGAELLLLVTGCRQNLRTDEATELQREQLRFARQRTFAGDGGPGFVDGVSVLGELVLKQKRPVAAMLLDEAHPTMAYNEVLADALVARLAPWVAKR